MGEWINCVIVIQWITHQLKRTNYWYVQKLLNQLNQTVKTFECQKHCVEQKKPDKKRIHTNLFYFYAKFKNKEN